MCGEGARDSNHVSVLRTLTDPSVPARVSRWACGLLRAERSEAHERRVAARESLLLRQRTG